MLNKAATFLWYEAKECLPSIVVVGTAALVIAFSTAGVLANIF